MRIGKPNRVAALALLLLTGASAFPAAAQSDADPAISCVAPRALISGWGFLLSNDRLFYIKAATVYRRASLVGAEEALAVNGDGFAPARLFTLRDGTLVAANFPTPVSGQPPETRSTRFWISKRGEDAFLPAGGAQILNMTDTAQGGDALMIAASNGLFSLPPDGMLEQISNVTDIKWLAWHKGVLYAARGDGLYRLDGTALTRIEGPDGTAVSPFEMKGQLFFVTAPTGKAPSFAVLDDDLGKALAVEGLTQLEKIAISRDFLAMGSQLMDYSPLQFAFVPLFDSNTDANAMHVQNRFPLSVLPEGDRVFVSYADSSEKTGSVVEWNRKTKTARVLPQPPLVIDKIFTWKGQILFANIWPETGGLYGVETTPWSEARVVLDNAGMLAGSTPRAAKPTRIDFHVTHPCTANMDNMVVKVSATGAGAPMEDFTTMQPALRPQAGSGAVPRALSVTMPLNGTGRRSFTLSFPAGEPAIGAPEEVRFGPLMTLDSPGARLGAWAKIAALALGVVVLVFSPILFIGARWSRFCQRAIATPGFARLIWPVYLPRKLASAQNWLFDSYFRARRRRGHRRGARIASELVVTDGAGAHDNGAALILRLRREKHIWLSGGTLDDRAKLFQEWRTAYFNGNAETYAAARADFGFAAIFIEAGKMGHVIIEKNAPERWLIEAAIRALKDSRAQFADAALIDALFRRGDFALVIDSVDGWEAAVTRARAVWPGLRLLVAANGPALEGFEGFRL